MTMETVSHYHFLSACHYITSIGIILNNNNLIATAVKNETVPVLNAFFQYLIKSENDSTIKIHPLDQIHKSTNYHYISKMTSLSDYNNIRTYVTNILKENNEGTFSTLEGILLENFFKYHIIKNVCSVRKESKKLSTVAAERIFKDLVSPIFTKIWNVEKQLLMAKTVKRHRRQLDENENQEIATEEMIKNCLEDIKTRGLSKTNTNKSIFSKIMSNLALQQINQNWMNNNIQLWFEETVVVVHPTDLETFLIRIRSSEPFFFGDFKLLTKNPNAMVRHSISSIWRPYSEFDDLRVIYSLTSDSQFGFIDLGRFDDDLSDLYLLVPDVPFTVKSNRIETINSVTTMIVELERKHLTRDMWSKTLDERNFPKVQNKRESQRMVVMEEAAKYLFLNVASMTFLAALDLMKSYLINVEAYGKLAQDYLIDMRVPDIFTDDHILNDRYTNDVLYESKFYFPNNIDERLVELSRVVGFLSPEEIRHYYTKYQSEYYLQERIRFEDYCRIQYVKEENIRFINPQANIEIALLRLALRQCDDYLSFKPITLYFAESLTESEYRFIDNYLIRLKMYSVIGTNREAVIENALANEEITGDILLFKLKLEDSCGLANIGEFTQNDVHSHILNFKTTFKTFTFRNKTIGRRTMITRTLYVTKNMKKEEKMKKLVMRINAYSQLQHPFYIEEK